MVREFRITIKGIDRALSIFDLQDVYDDRMRLARVLFLKTSIRCPNGSD
jgi:hypothetical protein